MIEYQRLGMFGRDFEIEIVKITLVRFEITPDFEINVWFYIFKHDFYIINHYFEGLNTCFETILDLKKWF